MRSSKTSASIVEAAVRLFGERGIEATSLRQVARTAGVSPALVVHHFGGKQGLIAAADDASLLAFGEAYGSVEPAAGTDLLRQRAQQTAMVMRERPEICAYLGRAMVEGTPGSTGLLRMMIAGGRAEIEVLAEQGALRADADHLWATLQHFFLIWAPLSFMPALEDLLDGSLLDEQNLERWVTANIDLFAKGLYR
jgi:AcrR family transcriptional regulator